MQNYDLNYVVSYITTNYPTLGYIFESILYGIAIFLVVIIIRKILHIFRPKSPNFTDGLIIIINFTSLAIWVAKIAQIFAIDNTLVLGGSALVITIIGISASYLGSNLMGGLFIIFTRPFGVGDIITYGGNRGLVTEIGLNYTKIMRLNKTTVIVPNSNVVNALIHNSTVFVKQNENSNELEIDMSNEQNDKAVKSETKSNFFIKNTAIFKLSTNKIANSFVKTFDIKKIVRFTFSVDIRQDMKDIASSIANFEERLKILCKEFEGRFGFEPEFYFEDNYWRITTTFVVTALNAKLLFENYSPFLQGILKSAYNIDLGGN
jgi:small-conductance mechanosensitive channel